MSRPDNRPADHIELEPVRRVTADVDDLAQRVMHLRYRVRGG